MKPNKQEIKTSQKLLSSFAVILNKCLENHDLKSTDCDHKFRKFSQQHDKLQHQEEEFLKLLDDSINQKREAFDKQFDKMGDSDFIPVELSEEAKKLKSEYTKDTINILETKRDFEGYRNKVLKKAVLEGPAPKISYDIDWEKKWPIEEIDCELKYDLKKSNEKLKSIVDSMESNKTAKFISFAEMFNQQIADLKAYDKAKLEESVSSKLRR